MSYTPKLKVKGKEKPVEKIVEVKEVKKASKKKEEK